MMLIRWLVFCLFVTSLSLAQTPLSLELERYLVTEVEQDGELIEVLHPAFELEPMQTIQETLFAHNQSDSSLTQVGLSMPIPAGMSYLAESAAPLVLNDVTVSPQFSYDAGISYDFAPLMKTITVIQNGQEITKEVEVSSDEYTHVRWVIPNLLPETQVTVAFKATVR